MSEAYERIWLQCPNTDPKNEWRGETTWCQDKINDDDVEYLRGDIVESLRQRVKELEEINITLVNKANNYIIESGQLANELAALKAAALSDDGASGEWMQLVIDNQALRKLVKELKTDLRESLLQERAECDRADAALKQESNGYRFSAENNYKLYTDLLAELNKLKAGQGKPVAYGLVMPNGKLDFELIGTLEDCKFWSRAESERQSRWKITPLYTSASTIPEGYVLMPKKVTMEMTIAASRKLGECDSGFWTRGGMRESVLIDKMYDELIAAAPKPEESLAPNVDSAFVSLVDDPEGRN